MTATAPVAHSDVARVGWLDRPASARALALVRVVACGALAATVAGRLVATVDLAERGIAWEPVGVLGPLGAPPAGAVVAVVFAVSLGAGVAATLGWRWRVSGPLFAATGLVATSLATSWGMVFHTDNLAMLHVAVIALAPAADAWSLDARGAGPPGDDVRYGFPIRLAALVTAATYVLAGWAKLRIGGLEWLDGDTLRSLVAHDNLRKELIGAVSTPLAGPVVRQAWLFAPMAIVTVAVELVAPLALVGRRAARAWVAVAWTFHVAIVAFMTVTFWYPLSLMAFVPTLLAAGAMPACVADRLR